MAALAPNVEEAANIASEFIYSIDNLPHEVSHLLQEIRHREMRSQELQQEIDKDSARYIRHSLRASSSVPPSPTSRAPSPKSSLIPDKITSSYEELRELANEKRDLAQRLIDLITRTRVRLDSDLNKVRVLQGDVGVEYVPSGGLKPISATPLSSFDSMTTAGRNPAQAISESLRNALATPLVEVRQSPGLPSTTASASASSATKRRRITTTTSVKISPVASPTKHRSASPTTTANASHATSHQRSRLSRQIHPPAVEDVDMDAEGEEDAEGEDAEGEDERLYCFCQKQSYGDMIACDNEGECPFEWFHLTCVGMKQPTPEKWYCSTCEPKIKAKLAAAAQPKTKKATKKRQW